MSPKGDPPGFVRVLDKKTLAIPDRLGNRRANTFKNLVVNDQAMAVGDRLPEFAVIVEVQQMFFHCAQRIIRSNLWNSAAWPSLSGLPSLAETMVSAGKLRQSVEEMQAIAFCRLDADNPAAGQAQNYSCDTVRLEPRSTGR